MKKNGSVDARNAKMPVSQPRSPEHVLSEEMLARFASRVAAYDRENRFFEEDFRNSGRRSIYCCLCPRNSAAQGMTLAEVCLEQRRLAYHAPATALAVNMHLYWSGLPPIFGAVEIARLEWICVRLPQERFLQPAMPKAAMIYRFYTLASKAERVEGGYRFTGRKQFGSLTPVWTRFGFHGMDTSRPNNPRIVHAFMPRDTRDT